MVVPSMADRYLRDCTTESSRLRPPSQRPLLFHAAEPVRALVCVRAGTPLNSGPRPSAIVGWVNTASRSVVYEFARRIIATSQPHQHLMNCKGDDSDAC